LLCATGCLGRVSTWERRRRSTSLLFLSPALSRLNSFQHAFPHVSGVMIIVNEDHEKQDSYSGLSIRPPDRVARRRRSLSTLPDYEASEAQYSRRLINKNTKVWHQTKLWRAILFSLLTYALLTIIIGVPIIVKVSTHSGASTMLKYFYLVILRK